MKIHKLYKSLITETQFESCVKRFGHELFGHELGGNEKNTGLENNYVRYIEDFTDNQYGEETTQEFLNAIKNLKGCIGKYPEVLTPEKTMVYRGTVIPLSYFVKHKQPIDLNNPNKYIYKANSKIQSWSTTFETASKFGDNSMINDIAKEYDDFSSPNINKNLLNDLINEDLRIAFILTYHTNPDEFLFNSKYFRILSMEQDEDELIRIDNTPIQTLATYNNIGGIPKDTMILIKQINDNISKL